MKMNADHFQSPQLMFVKEYSMSEVTVYQCYIATNMV